MGSTTIEPTPVTDEQREALLRWATALESGEHEQGDGQLAIKMLARAEQPEKVRSCCLGVWCFVEGLEVHWVYGKAMASGYFKNYPSQDFMAIGNRESATVPRELQVKLGPPPGSEDYIFWRNPTFSHEVCDAVYQHFLRVDPAHPTDNNCTNPRDISHSDDDGFSATTLNDNLAWTFPMIARAIRLQFGLGLPDDNLPDSA